MQDLQRSRHDPPKSPRWSTVWLLGVLSSFACASPKALPTDDRTSVDAAAMAVPSELPAATPEAKAIDAGADLDAATADCVHPAHQPNTCLNPDGPLEDEAVVGWFADRQVKVKDGYLGYAAHCTEVPFGPEADRVLVCTTDEFVPGPLFGNGPMGYHRDLRVIGVRNGKAFEFLRAPLAVTEALNWGADTLFSARYVVDGAAGAIELLAEPEECKRGRDGVAAYHQEWVVTLGSSMAGQGQSQRDQIAARKAQGRMDDARIRAICGATGRYAPVRGGALKRTKS